MYNILHWLCINPSKTLHESPLHTNPSIAPNDLGDSLNSWTPLQDPPCMALDFNRSFYFPILLRLMLYATITVNCKELPVHTKLFQISEHVIMLFLLPGMHLLFSSASPFCPTYSYSSFSCLSSQAGPRAHIAIFAHFKVRNQFCCISIAPALGSAGV